MTPLWEGKKERKKKTLEAEQQLHLHDSTE